MSYTSELADYVATLRYDALPQSVVSAAKRATLDLLGVIFPALQYEPAKVMNGYIRHVGGTPRATVIGTDIRTSTANAALANGTMAAEMEQDDVHPDSGTHPGSVYIPAMLAVAEDIGSSGRDWIVALIAAYDVGCRLSMAMDFTRQYSRGFHATGVSGTFGAAAGVARLLGLDSKGVEGAWGLTGCQAAGLLVYHMQIEHYTKSFQSGVPARNAVIAAELAARGYLGAEGILDGEHNVFEAFSTHENFPALTQELGSRYEIEHTGYKFYAACRAIHSPLDVLFELIAEHRFTHEDVAQITVWLPGASFTVVDNNLLTTHNLQFIMAAALVDGTITRTQTTPERRADPLLNEIKERVLLVRDDSLAEIHPEIGILGPSRTEVKLNDGCKFTVVRDNARGSVTRPVSDADIENKFLQMATQVISPDRARQIASIVWNLENTSSMRELTSLLSGSNQES